MNTITTLKSHTIQLAVAPKKSILPSASLQQSFALLAIHSPTHPFFYPPSQAYYVSNTVTKLASHAVELAMVFHMSTLPVPIAYRDLATTFAAVHGQYRDDISALLTVRTRWEIPSGNAQQEDCTVLKMTHIRLYLDLWQTGAARQCYLLPSFVL